MTYPEDCIQSLVSPRWVEHSPKVVERGALVRIAVPYVDVPPRELVVRGRSDPKDHTHVDYDLRQFNVRRARPRGEAVPVAAIPARPDEVQLVYRAKRRPGIVLGFPEPPEVPGGGTSWINRKVMLVAPCYGARQDGRRAGWPAVLVDSIRRCQHSQFVWDKLPCGGADESIVCLDRPVAVVENSATVEFLGFKLSGDAIEVVDEWARWCGTGTLAAGGILKAVVGDLADL